MQQEFPIPRNELCPLVAIEIVDHPGGPARRTVLDDSHKSIKVTLLPSTSVVAHFLTPQFVEDRRFRPVILKEAEIEPAPEPAPAPTPRAKKAATPSSVSVEATG